MHFFMTDLALNLAAQRSSQGYVLALTARIVAAHVSHNRVDPAELPRLIHKIHASLARLDAASANPAGPGSPTPAVPINRSVFPDYIICLENGRHFRTLRRHLMAAFGLTPEAYRRRWGLPHDYPMIAPSYATARSSAAKATGLGHRTSATPRRSRQIPGQFT